MNKHITIPESENSRFIRWIIQPTFLVALSVVSCVAILVYGSFVHLNYPYSGIEISWDVEFGQVSRVYVDGPADQAGVQVGDWLISIDGQTITQWGKRPVYQFGIQAGDIVNFEFQRGQEITSVPITIGGYFDNWEWVWDAFLVQVLALAFWGLGAGMCLFSPPRDARSRLLGLGFLLAGTTAVIGLAGGWNSFWGANALVILLRTWLGPVYVAAHLTFPAVSLPRYRRQIINTFALLALIITAGVLIEAWITVPLGLDLRRTAQIFFFVSWLVGTGLLLYNRRYSQDPEVKRQIGVVLWGSVLGFSPSFVFIILPYVLNQEPLPGSTISLVFLLLVPLSYLYVIHQRKLLRLDFAINRFVVLFVLLLTIFLASVVVLGGVSLFIDLSPSLSVIGSALVAAVVVPSAGIQRRIQVRVNRVLYGNHYDFSTVATNFSSRLAITSDRATLLALLTDELATQMRIKRSVLFLVEGDKLTLQLAETEIDVIPVVDPVCQFLLTARNPIRAQALWGQIPAEQRQDWGKYAWGELFVPMVFEGKLKGILIIGPRVTADLYNAADMQIIAAIAYQGALAYANVQLVETLRGLTRRLVRTDEAQRRQLARDLHDTVLQDLFFIRQKLPASEAELTVHLSNIIAQLRRTIKTQRTALLDQGLELALESLTMDMQALAGSETQIFWRNTVKGKLNLTDEQATSIYRIVQEAVTNAIKHAQADRIFVTLTSPSDQTFSVLIEDDGNGMQALAKDGSGEGHYGLAGMRERALMIGADLEITSEIEEGTVVRLVMTR